MNTSTTKLFGKSLVFTDLHVGISNDKASRQKIAENLIDEIIDRIETEGVKQVFFLGDLFHQRTSIEVTSLNVANDLVRKLASTCQVFLLQGNHDLYEKYNSIITSLNIFNLNNVNIVSIPQRIVLNNQNVLLVPWLCGNHLSEYLKPDESFDIMMGHFDVAYSGDIKNKGQKYVNAYRGGSKNYFQLGENEDIVTEILNYTHDYSTIFMGHIHEHETLTYANRTWNIVGSPQYQVHDMKRLPDEKKMHGYYILDDNNNEVFYESVSIPKFVTIYASDLVNGKIDASKLKGSIVRRCYDVALNDTQRATMDKLVEDAEIYEEDSSVFILGVNDGAESNESDGSKNEDFSEMLVMDKFDYIQKQIDTINHASIDNAKMSDMMKTYYNKAIL